MAEFGAFLTSATTDNRPSFFEVLAQESLMVTLRPALSYFLKVLAENKPSLFGGLYRWSDEVYAALDLILQHHFLSKTSASFAENFYSLKRIPSSHPSAPGHSIHNGLPKKEHWKSLLLLVAVPYLKMKMDAKFQRWKEESLDAGDRGQQTMLRYKRIFLAIYPYLHLSWESAVLGYQLRYLFKQSLVHSPFLKLADVHLEYLSEDDMQQLATNSNSGSLSSHASTDKPRLQNILQLKIPPMTSSKARLVFYLKRLVGAVAIAVSNGLSVGVFFLQFLEWWYMSEDHQSALAATSLPIPDPPKERQPEYCQILLPRDVTICPLCQKRRTNDTTLLTSGYVFCYPCIFSYIKKHGRCPVTRYPSEPSHLIKLYPPDR